MLLIVHLSLTAQACILQIMSKFIEAPDLADFLQAGTRYLEAFEVDEDRITGESRYYVTLTFSDDLPLERVIEDRDVVLNNLYDYTGAYRPDIDYPWVMFSLRRVSDDLSLQE